MNHLFIELDCLHKDNLIYPGYCKVLNIPQVGTLGASLHLEDDFAQP